MESNLCDVNHLDADVLLPPRKRLLAGLKRQNSDVNPQTQVGTSSLGNEFDARLRNLLKSHLANPNLSNEEIVEASRKAAIEAAKVAQAARAAAEEKAVKAAKAVAAAKSALELVATVTEDNSNDEKYLKWNKMKKHVPVQAFYNKQRGTQNCRTDEELARKLHQAINSSLRISKNSSTSESKNHKHKKLKTSTSTAEKMIVLNGGLPIEGNKALTGNDKGIGSNVSFNSSFQEGNMTRVDLNIPKFHKYGGPRMGIGETPKFSKSDQLNNENEEVETVSLGEKFREDDSGIGKKKGKLKQKKLPLSICNIRDQVSPKEDLNSKSLSLTEDNRNKATINSKSLFPVGPSADDVIPVESAPMRKCQAFKAPACVKQNKVMQS